MEPCWGSAKLPQTQSGEQLRQLQGNQIVLLLVYLSSRWRHGISHVCQQGRVLTEAVGQGEGIQASGQYSTAVVRKTGLKESRAGVSE